MYAYDSLKAGAINKRAFKVCMTRAKSRCHEEMHVDTLIYVLNKFHINLLQVTSQIMFLYDSTIFASMLPVRQRNGGKLNFVLVKPIFSFKNELQCVDTKKNQKSYYTRE